MTYLSIRLRKLQFYHCLNNWLSPRIDYSSPLVDISEMANNQVVSGKKELVNR